VKDSYGPTAAVVSDRDIGQCLCKEAEKSNLCNNHLKEELGYFRSET